SDVSASACTSAGRHRPAARRRFITTTVTTALPRAFCYRAWRAVLPATSGWICVIFSAKIGDFSQKSRLARRSSLVSRYFIETEHRDEAIHRAWADCSLADR